MAVITLDTFETYDIYVSSGFNFYMFNAATPSRIPYPRSHIEDAEKLEAEAKIDFFVITCNDKVSKIFLKRDNTITWQGNTYEGTAISISGVGQFADDETSRPRLTVLSPKGVFNALIDDGLLDGGVVERFRVLKSHVDQDLPVYLRQMWKISRVASIKGSTIALELRDMMDGQLFVTPPRVYMPPDFPVVSLG